MKRLIVIMVLLTIFMTGCKKEHLSSIETKPIEYSNVLQQSSLAINDDGVYFVEDGKLNYMNWKNLKSTKLASLNYADDKEIDDLDGDFKRYREKFSDGSDLVIYDNWLYGFFIKENVDGSFIYSINRLDLKGENYEEVLTFEDFPQKFRIDSGKIYVYFDDMVNGKFIIKTYDEQLNLAETRQFEPNEDPYGFYLEKGNLIIPETSSSKVKIYDNGRIKTGHEIINQPKSPGDTAEDTKVVGFYKNGEKEYKFPHKIISFVSEKYFYASSLSEKQTYERYNLDGTLDKTITPSEFITSEGAESVMYFESDFSLIDRVYKDRYIFGRSSERYFMCDLELESCRYLNE